jgi:fibronectin type 3 domain-containing protein
MKASYKIYLIKSVLGLIIATCLVLPSVNAQNAIAVSSTAPTPLLVALNWSPTKDAVRYQIFRKNAGDATYPDAPLSIVNPASNCFSISTLLVNGVDSTNWKIVASSLADSMLFNPCKMNTIAKTSEKYQRLQIITRRNMPIAKAAGLGYEDNTVVLGKDYRYRIVALNNANVVIGEVATDLVVTAGSFTPLPAPTSIIAEAGDAVVQIRWGEVAGAAGYVIERATSPAGLYRRVNASAYTTQLQHKLNGDTLAPNSPGFVDFQRYSPQGFPTVHRVLGNWILGPRNGVTYYYRIRSLDFFDRTGLASLVSNAATPRDSTPPSVANDLVATPDDIVGTVTIRWSQVTTDVDGHREMPDSSMQYRLYRFESSENPTTTPSVFVGEISTLSGQKSKDTTDSDPNLRRPFGNKTWWYRLRTVDVAGNLSAWSSAVSAIVKDNTPPAIVKGLLTTGMEDHIKLKWQQNGEPDIASYRIYRSLCHLGNWIECNPKDTCKEWQSYDPNPPQTEKGKTSDTAAVTTSFAAAVGRKNRLPCPCSGGFVFLGEITHDSTIRANTRGNMYFIDRTIPAGSPLCYAYWIKAIDSSGNQSGAFPIPSVPERSEIVCQRLRDLTPPESALIAGLFARDRSIRVEWMGPPTQDTRAYHVYRAKGTDPKKEPQNDDYKWVGGMTIELPPVLPKILLAPYTPPNSPPCDKISVQATPWMSQGSFDDKTVEPKLTYWYKVVGIDYDGNESLLSTAAAISTFTFSRVVPAAPIMDIATVQSEPCAVALQWSPEFDKATQAGFIVYRSTSAGGPFTPIVVSPLTENRFADSQVAKGQTYWYRIGTLMKNGRLSALAPAVSVTP